MLVAVSAATFVELFVAVSVAMPMVARSFTPYISIFIVSRQAGGIFPTATSVIVVYSHT